MSVATASPPTSRATAALAPSLLRWRGNTMLAASDLLDDRDGAEEDHEGQDAEERGVLADSGEDTLARRGGAGRRGRRVLAESRCVDTGVRVAARSAQGGQGAPSIAVVVLDLVERAGREAQGQVIARDERDRRAGGLRHAADSVNVAPNLDTRRWRGRVGIRRDRALDRLGTGRGLEGARTEVDDDLVVAGLHPAASDLAARHRQRRLAGQGCLIAGPQVGRRRFPPIRLGWNDDAVIDRGEGGR